MGTITTYSWCAAKDGRAYEGSKEDIIYAVCHSWGIDSERRLFIRLKDRQEAIFLHGYSDEWEGDDLRREMIRDAFGKLPMLGFKIYKDVG